MDFTKNGNRIYKLDDENKVIAEVIITDCGDDLLNIQKTFVDPSLRGQGIAEQLMEAAYEHIKSNNKKAILTCTYAIKWYEENADKRDILK